VEDVSDLFQKAKAHSNRLLIYNELLRVFIESNLQTVEKLFARQKHATA
jgi:hypothetical protein